MRLTSRNWFRRRSTGLGWRPVSWEAWTITLLAVAAVIGVLLILRASAARIPIVILILAGYAIVALLTGGSERRNETPATEENTGERPPERDGLDQRQRHVLLAVADEHHAHATPDGAALVVEHLSKRFGERVAVDDLSFTVAAGEVFGFLGPNGAGKTTTVRMLGTLITPTAGSATVAGISLEPRNDVQIRRRIAVMPENPGLYLRLSVQENLEFFAGLYDMSNPAARIRRALEAVNLAARASEPCGNLSKGLRQRVALARALMSDPVVLFLDEPTSGLDPVASHEVHDLIDRLREEGVTVFITTHRLEEAERLCDRVAILNTSLRTIGRPDELRDRLFAKTLVVRTAAPLEHPDAIFAATGVESWRTDGTSTYALTVTEARVAAPEVTRALVAAGADLLSLAETRHSLEDVYLELVADDVEARK
jgi:ABC-2 type transport system ATP-binding protein